MNQKENLPKIKWNTGTHKYEPEVPIHKKGEPVDQKYGWWILGIAVVVLISLIIWWLVG